MQSRLFITSMRRLDLAQAISTGPCYIQIQVTEGADAILRCKPQRYSSPAWPPHWRERKNLRFVIPSDIPPHSIRLCLTKNKMMLSRLLLAWVKSSRRASLFEISEHLFQKRISDLLRPILSGHLISISIPIPILLLRNVVWNQLPDYRSQLRINEHWGRDFLPACCFVRRRQITVQPLDILLFEPKLMPSFPEVYHTVRRVIFFTIFYCHVHVQIYFSASWVYGDMLDEGADNGIFRSNGLDISCKYSMETKTQLHTPAKCKGGNGSWRWCFYIGNRKQGHIRKRQEMEEWAQRQVRLQYGVGFFQIDLII